MKIECDIRTCEETNADRLMLMCDGLSGKRQMIICFDCHHAFFGTDAEYHEETYAGKEFSEPLESELTETLTDKELNKQLNLTLCCVCNDCDSESLTDCEHEVESCCDCEGHEWVIETPNNGVGHSWIEAECQHCDADITQDELEALYEPDY
jgi:DnaJ-class molecular chaperone